MKRIDRKTFFLLFDDRQSNKKLGFEPKLCKSFCTLNVKVTLQKQILWQMTKQNNEEKFGSDTRFFQVLIKKFKSIILNLIWFYV